MRKAYTIYIAGASLLIAVVVFLWYFYFKENSFEDYVHFGDLKYQEQKVADAIEYYVHALNKDPNNAKAPLILIKIGDVHNFIRQDLSKAEQSYLKVFIEYPNSSEKFEALLRLSDMFKKAENYKKVREYLSLLIQSYPKHSKREAWQFDKAYMAFKGKDYSIARSEFMKITEANPKTEFADKIVYYIAESLYLQEDLEQSEEFLKLGLEKYPHSELKNEMLYLLATVLERKGEFPSALELFLQLESSYPNPALIKKKIQKLRQFQTDQDRIEKLKEDLKEKPPTSVGKKGRISTQEASEIIKSRQENEEE